MGGPTPEQKVVVNQKRCVKCGWCEQACLYLAITFDTENPPVIDDKICEICGMCVALCPMDALSIENRN